MGSFPYHTINIYFKPILIFLMDSDWKRSKKLLCIYIYIFFSWILFNYEPKSYSVCTPWLPLNQVSPSLKFMLLNNLLIKKTCFIHILVGTLCKQHIIFTPRNFRLKFMKRIFESLNANYSRFYNICDKK